MFRSNSFNLFVCSHRWNLFACFIAPTIHLIRSTMDVHSVATAGSQKQQKQMKTEMKMWNEADSARKRHNAIEAVRFIIFTLQMLFKFSCRSQNVIHLLRLVPVPVRFLYTNVHCNMHGIGIGIGIMMACAIHDTFNVFGLHLE